MSDEYSQYGIIDGDPFHIRRYGFIGGKSTANHQCFLLKVCVIILAQFFKTIKIEAFRPRLKGGTAVFFTQLFEFIQAEDKIKSTVYFIPMTFFVFCKNKNFARTIPHVKFN